MINKVQALYIEIESIREMYGETISVTLESISSQNNIQ